MIIAIESTIGIPYLMNLRKLSPLPRTMIFCTMARTTGIITVGGN